MEHARLFVTVELVVLNTQLTRWRMATVAYGVMPSSQFTVAEYGFKLIARQQRNNVHGRRNRGSRVSGCSPTFGVLEQCSAVSLACDRLTVMIIYL